MVAAHAGLINDPGTDFEQVSLAPSRLGNVEGLEAVPVVKTLIDEAVPRVLPFNQVRVWKGLDGALDVLLIRYLNVGKERG